MEKRIRIASYIIFIISTILLLRLWELQILKGNQYRWIEERNRLRIINVHSPRGIIYDRNRKPLVKNVPSFDISVIAEDLPKDPETMSALGSLAGLSADELKKRIDKAAERPFEPVVLRQDVSIEDVARAEAAKIDFPGLRVDVVGAREYIYGPASGHITGYLGQIGIRQLGSPQFSDVPRDAFIGQYGIEKAYDSDLRGSPGKKVIEVDAIGSIVKVVRILRPVRGDDIHLTIDIDLQIEAEKNLQEKAGAIVALNPDTGEILAMASSPSFDPNLFARGINTKDWKRLVSDPKKPLLNRAIQSQYPPGSTFKIITAIAALEEGLVTKETSTYCNGSIFFGRLFRCWKKQGHGHVNLHKAIVESCDVYFYEVAKELNIDVLAQYAFSFGLGRPTGVELPGEMPGIVPTSGWKREKKNESWYRGETLNTVIGQGYLTATPMQMARLMAAVVNGGRLYRPFILKETGVMEEGRINIKPENVRSIIKSLEGVVDQKEGTGRFARSGITGIGGKTGTSQVVGGFTNEKNIPERFRDHAWFVAFAPEEKPQIAVAVFIEHGGQGGMAAAPVAKEIIETFYKKQMI